MPRLHAQASAGYDAVVASDDELLTAWAEGDRDAAAVLIERHSDELMRFFRSKLDVDIEDLIQRTFLDCLEQRERRTGVESFRAYMFGVARNRLYDHFRRQRVRGIAVDPDRTSLADLHTSPSAALARHDEQRLLLEGLRQLPLDLQLLLELFYWENLSGPDLASIFGVPEGTIRGRIRRAKTLLRERLAGLEGSPQRLESTLTRLEDWARSLRDCVA